ncbi:MAG: flagellar M-ring protein FliF [Balneola sp.]|nr:flagellar M-ring protein FliF [Balneola sp.]|tara:strand:- start:10060 stop:11700 length:1641 start_codon:yes stop_codon:yes gene_type:complete
MANTDNQLQDFFGVMNSAQKVMFGLLLSLVIIISGAIFFWAQQDEQVLLFGNLNLDNANSIVQKLDEKNIDYKISDGGNAIYVPSDKVHSLRLELASYGGGNTENKGYELFDTQSLGMTDFMQQVNQKRALEGELSRSINSLTQVRNSRVHLVLQERSPFEESSVEASASVILTLEPGNRLSSNQTSGIASLISGSVEGLSPNSVVILDQLGNRLSDDTDQDAGGDMGSVHMQIKQKTEAYLTDKGQSMLDRVLGAGNSIVRVSVEHDFEKVMKEIDTIDPDSRIVVSETNSDQTTTDEDREQINATDYTPVEYMDEALIIGSNTVESSTQSRNYEVNRTKEYIEETQGEITYISASILLNTPLIPNVNDDGETIFEADEYDDVRLNEFRDLIAKAIGIEGDEDELVDKIAISQIEFYYNPYRENLEYQESQEFDWERWGRVAAILISLLLAGFLVNNVRKNFSGSVMQTTSNFQMENGELAGVPDLASLPTQNLDQTQAASQPALEGENEMPQQNSNAIKDEVEKLFVSQPSKATEVARLMFENG